MTGMLASVTNVHEAMLAVEAGVDFIDLKNPVAGALGALDPVTIKQIVDAVGGRKQVSATIGDLPMHGQTVAEGVSKTAACGVDIVKIGFFGTAGHASCVDAVRPLIDEGVRIVAVLFADDAFDARLLPKLANAGFYGAMLDTAGKNGQRLTDILAIDNLADFVASVRAQGMISGLAGSLSLEDIEPLSELRPDYLGFRGALCADHNRKSALEILRVKRVLGMLRKRNIPACKPV